VPENVVLPENPESKAASAQGLHRVKHRTFIFIFLVILESSVFAEVDRQTTV
jgi:hypothetical protein